MAHEEVGKLGRGLDERGGPRSEGVEVVDPRAEGEDSQRG